MTAVAKKVWTDQELLALPKDGRKREIIDGELIVSPATPFHGAVILRIASRMVIFATDRGLGEVFDGQSGCRMLSGDLPCPDISFVSKKRWDAYRASGETFFQGAPDIAVEVVSPHDRVGELKSKIAQFFENGTRLAWLVDPEERTVLIYHGPSADRLLGAADSLSGEDVLPGFTLALKNVFID
jgi:Uma2 family endonuclease